MTKQLLPFAEQIQPNYFVSTAITLDAGPFTQKAADAGSKINKLEGLNVYQDRNGTWQVAVTAHLTNSTASS